MLPPGLEFEFCERVSVDGLRGDEVSAAALPPVSEAPSGIRTFSLGREPALVIILLVRDGTVKVGPSGAAAAVAAGSSCLLLLNCVLSF